MSQSRGDREPSDRVVLVGWLFKFKPFKGRTATLVQPKSWFGQRAWLVDLDGGWLSRSKPGSVRTTVTERFLERPTESRSD